MAPQLLDASVGRRILIVDDDDLLRVHYRGSAGRTENMKVTDPSARGLDGRQMVMRILGSNGGSK